MSEPRRLFRRYVAHDIPYAVRLIIESSAARLARRNLSVAAIETACASHGSDPLG
jgi:hypothetical protein